MEQQESSTHRRILDAAEKLFAEKGYRETTTREIVREAGASLSSLQAHFQSKENVYYEVRLRAMDKLHQFMKPTIDEVNYLERQGMLYGEMAWNLLGEIVSKYAAWTFDAENRHVMTLISRELLEGAPIPNLPEETIINAFAVIQRLCERYTQTKTSNWSPLIGHILFGSILFSTMLSFSGYGRWFTQTERESLGLSQPSEEVKYQLKNYMLLTLRAYLDIRKAGPGGEAEEGRPDQER